MSTQKHNNQSKSLLNRLRTAVQKVRLLLSSTVLSQTWHAANMIRRASTLSNRRLSFTDQPDGLKICYSDETGSEESGSNTPSPPPPGLQRTISFPSDEDDIDRRAEMFIASFRKQLRMERQISLQLRYHREHSFQLISP